MAAWTRRFGLSEKTQFNFVVKSHWHENFNETIVLFYLF